MSDVQRVAEAEKSKSTIGVKPVSSVEQAEEELRATIPRAASSEAVMPSYEEQAKLSETGKAVLEDISKVASDTQRLMEERVKPSAHEASTKIGRELSLREELETLMSGLGPQREDWGRVVRLLVTSGEFRKMLFDFTGILQDTFKDYRFEKREVPSGKVPSGKVPSEKAPSGEKVTGKEPLEELESKLKVGEKGKSTKVNEEDTYMIKVVDQFGEFIERARQDPQSKEALSIIFKDMKSMDTNMTLVFKEEADMTSQERLTFQRVRESDLNKVLLAGRAFIERWINASLSPMIKGIESMRVSLGKDQELMKKMNELGDWFSDALESDKPVNKDHLKSSLLDLRAHLTDDYRGQFNHLTKETRFIANRIQSDELTLKLTSDMNDLVNHLFRDDQGNLTIKPELWSDLKVVLPTLLSRIRFVQIPELVVRDESVDFKAAGIALNVGEIAPKRIQAHLYSEADTEVADIMKAQDYDIQTVIILEAGKIFAEARNVYFEFERKTFPKLTDSGIADLAIHGDDGMSLHLTFGARRQQQVGNIPLATGIKLLRAKCEIDELDLRFHQTKHAWMYTVLGPLIRRQLRLRIQEEIEKSFMSGDWLETVTSPAGFSEVLQQSVQQ